MSEPHGKPESVTVECALEESSDKVWRALSIPESRDSWLTPRPLHVAGGSPATGA